MELYWWNDCRRNWPSGKLHIGCNIPVLIGVACKLKLGGAMTNERKNWGGGRQAPPPPSYLWVLRQCPYVVYIVTLQLLIPGIQIYGV